MDAQSSSTRSQSAIPRTNWSLVEDTSETTVDEASATPAVATNPATRRPTLRTRENSGGIFSRFFLESDEDAQLRVEARNIAKVLPSLVEVERKLTALNEKLDALLRQFGVPTVDGTALFTAAANVEAAILVAMAKGPDNRSPHKPVCSKAQWSKCKEIWKTYDQLYKSTDNPSKEIRDRYSDLQKKYMAMQQRFQAQMVSGSDSSQDSDEESNQDT